MDFQALKELDEQVLTPTGHRLDVALDHGAGAVLWDLAGKDYIDFAAGGGVNTLGCGNEAWVRALVEQAVKLGHGGNQVYTQPQVELARRLTERSGMGEVCFTASGSEANEGMFKLARKYSFEKYGKGRETILTLENGRHGQTLAALAAGGREDLYGWLLAGDYGFRHGEASLEGLEEAAGHDVCAVLLELVQAQGGGYAMDRGFVHDLAVLCAERDWLLLLDEVRTGAGRTGTLFAYQQYGVLPDAVSFAGGMAGGLPLAGFMASDKCRGILGPGDQGSTFGGNPVCAAVALAVLDALDEAALAQVRELGDYLRSRLEALDVPCLGAVRGLGLLVGVEVRRGYQAEEVAQRLLRAGLLTLPAEHNTLLLTPPLTITRGELEQGLERLETALSEA